MKRLQNTTVLPVGWAYLTLIGFTFAAALLRDINLLMVLCCFMTGPVLLNWQTVLMTLRGVDVHRRVPRTICVGDPLVVELSVSSQRRRGTSWCFSVHDSICRIREDGRVEKVHPAQVLVPRLDAGETIRAAYYGRLVRRGRYRLGPLRLAAAFPLGLVQRNRLVDERDTLVVYPPLGQLTHRWSSLFSEAVQGSPHVQHQHGWQQGDFHSLRDWRPGDSTRWIHWRTSARKQQLMVRQFEQQANQDFIVLVSLWRPQPPSDRDLQHVETAVTLAATIVADVCRRGGCRLKLVLGTKEPSWMEGSASTALYDEAMRRLAVAEASTADNLDALLAEAISTSSAGARIVVVSPREVDPYDATTFTKTQRAAQRRGGTNRVLALDASSREVEEYFRAPQANLGEPAR